MTSDSLRGGTEGSSVNDEVAICKRPACGKPVPATTRGRTRQFCSNECARRFHNDARLPARKSELADADDPLSALDALLRQAMTHLRAMREQASTRDMAKLRSQLAEAEELRRRAESDAAAAAAALAAARDEASTARQEASTAQQEACTARADAERSARERDAARAALIKRVPSGRLPHTPCDHHQDQPAGL